MANYKVEKVPAPLDVLGESPHWDFESQTLYYIDLRAGIIHRYDVTENKVYSATVDGEKVISFIIPVAGTKDEFAIGICKRIGIIQWDGVSPKAVLVRIAGEVEGDEPDKVNRFNDGKADKTGRLYSGTMARLDLGRNIWQERSGSLYKYSKDGKFDTLKEDCGISNGLTWNYETNKFYFIDSADVNVKEYDYDAKTGNISNSRVVISLKVGEGQPSAFPDGLTIDNAGNLYVAVWGGSKILQVNPTTGKITKEIKFPCAQVTCAAFGGPNLNILYVTTAAVGDNPTPEASGALYKVTGLGVTGTQMSRVKF